MSGSGEPENGSARSPRLPVYLDGELLEALAQTLDPAGVPGNRKVRTTEGGQTVEGSGYAIRASGRIGARLLGAQAGVDAERDKSSTDETRSDLTEEQGFIVRPATLLWQAYSILSEEQHLCVIDGGSIDNVRPGDWIEASVRSTGRSLISLSRLLSRIVNLQAHQRDQRLERLREGEALLRAFKGPAGMKLGDLSVSDARSVFMTELVSSLARASDEESLQATAAVEGFAEELLTAIVSDVRAEFVDPKLKKWSALLTVRTESHAGISQGVLHDAEFGVFGKVTRAQQAGDGVSLVRRTMLDWMDADSLQSVSEDLRENMGGGSLTVDPPVLQILPLALWV